MGHKPFTDEQKKLIDEFVLLNYDKLTTMQIAEKLNISKRSVLRSKERLKVETPKNLIWHFDKTRFKKGEASTNRKPMYYEFFNEFKQEIYIKFKDGISNNFKPKKVFIWEQINGKIPKGFVVRYKDGNNLNNTIENLYLISKAEIMNENSFNRYPNEIRANCNLIAKIKREISHE